MEEISGPVSFRVEHLKSSVDIDRIDNYSHFSAVRLAKKHYEREGSAVLEGSDFENNMTLFFYDVGNRMLLDGYVRTKLGRANRTAETDDYARKVLALVPEDVVKKLLSLCRLCSYSGDPGFPDLMILGKELQLKYVLFDELTPSQVIFLALSKLAGMNVDVVRMAVKESDEEISINLAGTMRLVLADRRAKNIMEGFEAGIKSEENRDELNYLEKEKGKVSLFLFDKWLKNGKVSAGDVAESVDFILSNMKYTELEKYAADLENDSEFSRIRRDKTEDGMRMKAEYMQKKFGIGESRARALLGFF